MPFCLTAAPIEAWLSQHYTDRTYGHAFGYNAEEPKRVAKSHAATLARNVAFGFNSEETGRIERATRYDDAGRIAFYPLMEWGWTRQDCLDYIKEKLGVVWQKSACVYCPFAHNKKNLVQLESRQVAHPQQTADALMLERMSLALNPRGSLYRSETLMSFTRRAENTVALEQFERVQHSGPWAIYRVRRIYGAKAGFPEPKKGTVQRAVEKQDVFSTETAALSALIDRAQRGRWDLVRANELQYAYVEYRTDSYPAREEYYVVAPARVETKARYGIDAFNPQWQPEQYGIAFAELAAADR